MREYLSFEEEENITIEDPMTGLIKEERVSQQYKQTPPTKLDFSGFYE
ncbi:hypothetical protein LC040_02520 [Bacillus tianshenii]|nr:hypothetical protein LC040_02520 [Bacillus tianshenii]